MSSSHLRIILEDDTLSNRELSCKLQSKLITLHKMIDPVNNTVVNFQYDDLEALLKFLAKSKDRAVLMELLALLRNVVPFNKDLHNKLAISEINGILLELVFQDTRLGNPDDQLIMCYRRLLQYFANLLGVINDTSQNVFFLLFRPGDQPLLQLLRNKDEKLVLPGIIVLSRLLKTDENFSHYLRAKEFVEITEIVIEKCLDACIPESLDILKKIVGSSNLFTSHFDAFNRDTSRFFLLDLICEQLSNVDSECASFALPQESLQFCIERVKAHLQDLRCQSTVGENSETPLLFVKFITVLALSSLKEQNPVADDLELLVLCIECLRAIHNFGKQGAAGFDPRTDYESLTGNKEIFDHPLFGLKRDLVRLIANMIFKHKLNQDTVRDYNGIELLCDMSSLDARNPYITEWVVLALKYLMDGNQENQKIIASLTENKKLISS